MPDNRVRGQLLAKIDELVDKAAQLLIEIRAPTEQFERERGPGRGRNAITMAAVMIDEIRLLALARPLDKSGQ
jgi:hypothetical protein